MTKYLAVKDALYRAGAELQKRNGARPIHLREIAERTIEYSNCAFGSVIPADYSYNLVNRAPLSCSDPFFIYEGQAHYRFVDRAYPYTGDVVWRPVGGKRQIVGHWRNGKVRFTNDPRRAP